MAMLVGSRMCTGVGLVRRLCRWAIVPVCRPGDLPRCTGLNRSRHVALTATVRGSRGSSEEEKGRSVGAHAARFGAVPDSHRLRPQGYQRGSDRRRLPPPKPPPERSGFGRASLTVRLRPPIE